MNHARGILLHITSLPAKHGIGDLGPAAFDFVDFLNKAGQQLWQILPMTPTQNILGNSPYSSYSAFAGNPLMISLEKLIEDGFCSTLALKNTPAFSSTKICYVSVSRFKHKILDQSFKEYRARLDADKAFLKFCLKEAYWLEDHSLFVAAKHHFKEVAWNEWPKGLRDRDSKRLAYWHNKLKGDVLREKYFQFLFFYQWNNLKKYCCQKKVQIIGDCPIYVTHDSVDVWANQGLFKLAENKKPLVVAGVPPDYFSKTGQRWGNPVYDWKALKKDGYLWWKRRFESHFKMFDFVRLDHFRGFMACWEIPSRNKTAVHGQWVNGPGFNFFQCMKKYFKKFPIIAEDLGMITDDVKDVIHHFKFPGMRVLLFSFSGDSFQNPHWIDNHSKTSIVYTGTHDNNTIKGWWQREASKEEKLSLALCLGKSVSLKRLHLDLIELALRSRAEKVIIPLQDILGLGSEARMNRPGRKKGNWTWRVTTKQLIPFLVQKTLKFKLFMIGIVVECTFIDLIY